MFKLLNKAAHSFRENEMTHISCCYHHYQMKINIVEFVCQRLQYCFIYIKTGFVGFDVYIHECMYCSTLYDCTAGIFIRRYHDRAHKLFFVLMKMEYFSISDNIGLRVYLYIISSTQPNVAVGNKEKRSP